MGKIKYPILGYAPGNYTCKCSLCDEDFIGDKYARQCETCAINSLNKSHSILLEENRELKSVLEKIKDIKEIINKF